MKYFVKIKFVAAVLCAVFVMQGCDWVKGQMGMPTSEDIARMKQELQLQQEQIAKAAEEARMQRMQDSIKAAQAEAQLQRVSGYYVVLGSFKDHRNADALEALVRKFGYGPETIMLKNGFKMVVVGGFSTYSQAYREMEKIGEKDFCPYDMWVYGASQGLHE